MLKESYAISVKVKHFTTWKFDIEEDRADENDMSDLELFEVQDEDEHKALLRLTLEIMKSLSTEEREGIITKLKEVA